MFSSLHIHHLRCLTDVDYQFHARFNFIQGDNGSGKTSFLEALYLLSTGHSFRTRESAPLIATQAHALTLYAKTFDDQVLSLQKSRLDGTMVHLNHFPCQKSSELARRFPCQVIYQDIFQIIDAGPLVRRHVLDWGMFHVKQTYHDLWQHYRKILKQRNALLRQRAPAHDFEPWDKQLAESGEALHVMRQAYVEAWMPHFNHILQQLSDLQCDMTYYKGWGKRQKHKDLFTTLQEHLDSDLQRQYTQIGPHQADLHLEVKHVHTRHGLSRGQQKIILIALKLSQGQMLGLPCTYLIDDVVAELDQKHLRRFFEVIEQIPGQFFLTFLNYHDQIPAIENSLLWPRQEITLEPLPIS